MDQTPNETILTFFINLTKVNRSLYSINSSNIVGTESSVREFNVAFINPNNLVTHNVNKENISLIINGNELSLSSEGVRNDSDLELISFNIKFVQEYTQKYINRMEKETVPVPGDIKGSKELQDFLEQQIETLCKSSTGTTDAVTVFPYVTFISLIKVMLENYFNKGVENEH